MNFIANVIASVVASAIVLVCAALASKRARWILTATLGRLLDIDVEYVFKNAAESESDVRHELDRATSIRFLSGRGNDLQRELFSQSINGRPGPTPFHILLPATNASPDWTAARELELAQFDRAFGAGTLKEQIATSARFVEDAITNGAAHLRLRRFALPHIGRILLTDRCAYFTPYRAGAHGRECRVIKYRRGGDNYDFLSRLFDVTWAVSTPDGRAAQASSSIGP